MSTLGAVLKACGDQLTREDMIRRATSLHGDRMPMMLLGITISTTHHDYAPFKTLRIAVFDGTSWTRSGEPITAD
jgi:branched-chain amino acid transport system substrate-binding protein